jgi:hypothetical protein
VAYLRCCEQLNGQRICRGEHKLTVLGGRTLQHASGREQRYLVAQQGT